jgi:hypothetical protein
MPGRDRPEPPLAGRRGRLRQRSWRSGQTWWTRCTARRGHIRWPGNEGTHGHDAESGLENPGRALGASGSARTLHDVPPNRGGRSASARATPGPGLARWRHSSRASATGSPDRVTGYAKRTPWSDHRCTVSHAQRPGCTTVSLALVVPGYAILLHLLATAIGQAGSSGAAVSVRGVAQSGSAPALGAGGPGFESRRPDYPSPAPVAQVDRATAF